jgi:excisionase family DNA binding protein
MSCWQADDLDSRGHTFFQSIGSLKKQVHTMNVDADKIGRMIELISERAEVERKLMTALAELLIDVTGRLRQCFPPPLWDSEKPLLTIREVCERAQISRVTLYRLMRKGAISYYKIGGRVLFDESQLQEFLRQHQQKTKRGRPTKRATRAG